MNLLRYSLQKSFALLRLCEKQLIAVLLVLGAAAALLISPPALAQDEVSPTEAMQVGNSRYESGDYSEAVEIYETITDAGVQNSSLYFNLGNAYFKNGDLGRAILNYRRAQYLDPRDSAIAQNLTIARLQTIDRLDDSAAGGLANLIQIAEEWLTLGEAAVLALLLWLVTSALLTVAILSRRVRKYALWAAAVPGFFLLVGLLSMANRTYTASTTPPAVIVAQQVDVTSGPGSSNDYVVEFTLHSGAEVRITDRRPDWRQIALPGESFKGWVPAEAVTPVIPQ